MSDWWDSWGSGNPVETGTLYDLVLMCAGGSPQPWWSSYGEWSSACWVKDEVQKRYPVQSGCPAKVSKEPAKVASEVAANAGPLITGTVPASVVETAALQYAQMLYPLAQVNYQVQLGLCAMPGGGTKPLPVPVPVPGPGPGPATVPVPVPGGQAQPQLPPVPAPTSPAHVALLLGAVALAGAFFWSRRKRR